MPGDNSAWCGCCRCSFARMLRARTPQGGRRFSSFKKAHFVAAVMACIWKAKNEAGESDERFADTNWSKRKTRAKLLFRGRFSKSYICMSLYYNSFSTIYSQLYAHATVYCLDLKIYKCYSVDVFIAVSVSFHASEFDISQSHSSTRPWRE